MKGSSSSSSINIMNLNSLLLKIYSSNFPQEISFASLSIVWKTLTADVFMDKNEIKNSK